MLLLLYLKVTVHIGKQNIRFNAMRVVTFVDKTSSLLLNLDTSQLEQLKLVCADDSSRAEMVKLYLCPSDRCLRPQYYKPCKFSRLRCGVAAREKYSSKH